MNILDALDDPNVVRWLLPQTRRRGRAMTVIGYARVSTTDQDLSIQETALRSAGCEVTPNGDPEVTRAGSLYDRAAARNMSVPRNRFDRGPHFGRKPMGLIAFNYCAY